MLRDVLLPRAARFILQLQALFSSKKKFPAKAIKLLWAYRGMLSQKKQLINHYLEHMFITKGKKGQEISEMSRQAFSLILHACKI